MKRTKSRGNGQGTVYKDGTYWRAQVTHYEGGDRATKSKSGFKSKTEALRWCALNADFADAGICPTFERVFSEWSAAHYPTISAKKQQQYDHVLDASGKIAKRKFNELTVRHFQMVVNDQKETYAVRVPKKPQSWGFFCCSCNFRVIETKKGPAETGPFIR